VDLLRVEIGGYFTEFRITLVGFAFSPERPGDVVWRQPRICLETFPE
jgi:hypothetical protein